MSMIGNQNLIDRGSLQNQIILGRLIPGVVLGFGLVAGFPTGDRVADWIDRRQQLPMDRLTAI